MGIDTDPETRGTEDLATLLEGRLVELSRLLRGQATAAGLSITALSVLRRLAESGPCRITDLAGKEAVTQPSLTALADRLAERGLTERGPDPADGRAVLVSITSAGRDLLAEVRGGRAAVLAQHLDSMDDGERAALAAAIPALDHLLAQGDR